MAVSPQHDWYLKEWLATLGTTTAWLEAQTGWTHRIASQLVNRRLRWNRDHLSLAAATLNIAAHELLLHPEDAMAIRRVRESALSIAAESRQPWTPAPTEDLPLVGTRN